MERLELDGAFQCVIGDAEVDRLTHLNISGTISSEIAQMICKCKSLTTLFLKIKAVTGQPYSVEDMATLNKMELARVELETPQASSLVNMIGKMPYLRELTLNGRSLTASEVAPLAQCTRLKELHIGGIDDPNTPLAFLNSMPALEECRLTYCPHVGRVHLNGLRDLRELYVMSSELGELEINGLENLTRVELDGGRPELSLGRLVIRDAPALKYLIVLGHKSNLALTEIELADCPVLRGLKLYAPPLAIQSTPCRLKTSGKFLNLVERRLMNLATDRASLDRLMESNLKGTDLVQDVQLDGLNAN